MSIVVRNRNHQISAASVRESVEATPFDAALFAGLSATFPAGERFFVVSVRRYEKDVPADLARDVAGFVAQEAHHAREHLGFNTQVGEAGYPIDELCARADRQLQIVGSRSALHQLGTTLALEHFTAVFAKALLSNGRHLAFADGATQALWRWHAIEEIEHKCVAYDVFLHATRAWPGFRRYAFRVGLMLDAVTRLAGVTLGNVGAVLKAQGRARALWQIDFLRFLLVSPGLLTQMAPDFLRFFAPGFHPSQCNDAGVLAAGRQHLEKSGALA